MKRIIILLLLTCAGITLQAQGADRITSKVVPVSAFEDLYRFQNFYISAQPEVARITWLKDHGIKVIINLRSAEENEDFKEESYDEQFVAEKLGFTYYSLPIDGNTGFTPENQAAFNDLLNTETPTLVHCNSGRRATYLFIVYLVEQQGYALQDAVDIGKQMKYSSPLEQLLNEKITMEITTN